MKRTVFSLILFAAIVLASCDDMEDKIPVTNVPIVNESTQIFILSEGLFNMNNSTLAMYNFAADTVVTDYFLANNKRGLGDTANDMALYGAKLYVVVNVSSQIEVLDVETGISVAQIAMFDEKGTARQPRYITFWENKAYVCSFDGTVARIDTATLSVEKLVNVGRNPDGICIANNKIYVSNSGGLSFPNYDNTVSVIDLNTFTEIKKIVVDKNPYKIHADSQGDVYVVSRGDYGATPYSFQRISSVTDAVVERFDDIQALNFCIHKDTAYIYNYDFSTAQSWIKVFDCKTEKVISDNFISDNTTITTPYGINVNPFNGDVYVTDGNWFTMWGHVFCFDNKGKLKFKLTDVGLNPNKVVFRPKYKQE